MVLMALFCDDLVAVILPSPCFYWDMGLSSVFSYCHFLHWCFRFPSNIPADAISCWTPGYYYLDYLRVSLLCSGYIMAFTSIPESSKTWTHVFRLSSFWDSFVAFPLYLRLDVCCNMLAVSFDMCFSFIRIGRLLEKNVHFDPCLSESP
jgi:hypothetical protein